MTPPSLPFMSYLLPSFVSFWIWWHILNTHKNSKTNNWHVFSCNHATYWGPVSVVGIATGYGDRIPVGARFCAPVQTKLVYNGLLYNGYRFLPGDKERTERDADPHSLLVPWSRKSRTIPLLPLWAVQPVHSLSACTKVHFTLLYLMQQTACLK